MGADSFGNAAGKLTGIEHHYDDSYEAWYLLMETWCPLSYQVCKPQAHAYVFCDIDNFPVLRTLMQQAGWYVFRTPFICVKPNSGRVPLPDQGPRRQYETLLYAIKGKKPVTHIYPDVISTTADEQLSHGAQKPIALFKNLLQRSVRPGDTVLDCFAGTGPIIPAAHHFQCKAIVLEKEKEYYAICCERLKALEEGE
jgi:DNA modification methylase